MGGKGVGARGGGGEGEERGGVGKRREGGGEGEEGKGVGRGRSKGRRGGEERGGEGGRAAHSTLASTALLLLARPQQEMH